MIRQAEALASDTLVSAFADLTHRCACMQASAHACYDEHYYYPHVSHWKECPPQDATLFPVWALV